MMGELSDYQIGGLRWMIRCNDDYRCGFLGPSVKRGLDDGDYRELVRSGLARRVDFMRRADRCGYFITPAGRVALSSAKPVERDSSRDEKTHPLNGGDQ